MTTDNTAHARQLVASGADLASVNDVCCFVLLLGRRYAHGVLPRRKIAHLAAATWGWGLGRA